MQENRIRRAFLSLLKLATLTFLITGSTMGAGVSAGGVPTHECPVLKLVVDKARSIIVSRVGDRFYENYIIYDPESSRCDLRHQDASASRDFAGEETYSIVFALRIPEKPFIDEFIRVSLHGSRGNLAAGNIHGVPDCVSDSQECEFPVDELSAIQIAAGDALEAGRTAWETSFHWYAGDFNTYVWVVSNTLLEDDGRAEGKSIVIDANTGLILWRGGWFSYSCGR